MRPQDQITNPEALAAEKNRNAALEMKIGGATFREIAKTLGVSVSTAHGYVADWLAETREENEHLANDLKRIALARLNKMRVSLWTKRDQPRVADTLLRIDEREARLLGLDAPLRWEGSGPGGGPIPVSGEIDLSKLTIEQLKQLEEIVAAASATAQAAVPVATIAAESMAGEPVSIVPAPVPAPSTDALPPVTQQATLNGDRPS